MTRLFHSVFARPGPTRRPGRVGAALAALLVAGIGCGSREEQVAEPFVVPRPDLSQVDEAVARQLTEIADEVEELLGSEEGSPAVRAAAVGGLARHYHAYDLTTDAERCYLEALRLEPGDSDSSYLLGFLYQVRGDLEPAADRFERVLSERPGDLAAMSRLADISLQLGERQRAAELYRTVLAAEPGSAAAHRGLAEVASEEGRPGEAVEHYLAALELQPQASAQRYPLALAYRALGDEASASLHLERSGDRPIDSNDPRVSALDQLALGAGVRLARGGVALAQGRVEEAIEEYRQAVEAAPDNLAARINLALLLAGTGELEPALAELDEALRIDPEALQARLAKADVLLASGEARRAVEAFDQVLAYSPGHVRAHRGRAAAHLELGGGEAARGDLEVVVEADRSDGAARLRLGSVLQEAGELDRAEALYREALALELTPGERAATRLGLGNLSAGRGSFEAAVKHYDAALALNPEVSEAHYNRAGALSRLGRLDESAAAYRRVLELEPSATDASFYLGDVLLRSGRSQEAFRAFSQTVVSDPEHQGAWLGSVTALQTLGREREALAVLERATARLPRSAVLAQELARTLASASEPTLRDGERAVEIAAALFTELPTPQHAETLARALAQAGRFEEAIELQRGVIAEMEPTGDQRLLERFRATLRLYEEGEACCPPPS